MIGDCADLAPLLRELLAETRSLRLDVDNLRRELDPVLREVERRNAAEVADLAASLSGELFEGKE